MGARKGERNEHWGVFNHVDALFPDIDKERRGLILISGWSAFLLAVYPFSLIHKLDDM